MSVESDSSYSRALLEQFSTQNNLALNEEQVSQLFDYCAMITRWNRLTSLVQAESIDELMQAHVIDCLAAVHAVKGPTIVDVGSGAGLPGIVFAIAKPDWHYYLIEANQRRARFLTQAKIELKLDNVTVVNTRIEHWRPPGRIDCITSRAFSALGAFYAACRHLISASVVPDDSQDADMPLDTGTRFVALKGRVDQEEVAALPVAPEKISVRKLEVPGREHRNVVIIECGKVSKLNV
ncbi:MAG: 16S rRNA (guanine(527)-N(7))-methyltransferase RsmG [Gammaproteobacteria bacterium]